MDGRITLREGGQIFLAGRTFRITRGDISFTDRRHIHPEFNIAAEANLGGDDGNVTMTLTGTLERPTIDLDLRRRLAHARARSPREIVGSTNTETALTLLSADLLGVTGRAIGLDAFRVERGDFEDRDFREDPTLIGNNSTDPTTRLTVGKRLSDQVEFTVSQNLRENGKATFIVSYFPRRNVELRALSRDSGTVSLGVRHQVTFGGGDSRPPSERRVRPRDQRDHVQRRRSRRSPRRRAPRSRSRKATSSTSSSCRRTSIASARPSTSRASSKRASAPGAPKSEDARSVALEFIDRSRSAHHPARSTASCAPASLIEELEEAWHKNVFDQFLIDDLTHRVRRHLVDHRRTRPAWWSAGSIGPTPDTKRLRIEVTPGAPVTGREIRFAGNLELDARAPERGDRRQPASRSRRGSIARVVEKALRQVYNEEGFLKAEIVGRPLTIDGTIGVLWFDIKEGPRAQITEPEVGRCRRGAPARRREGRGDRRRRRRTSPPT